MVPHEAWDLWLTPSPHRCHPTPLLAINQVRTKAKINVNHPPTEHATPCEMQSSYGGWPRKKSKILKKKNYKKSIFWQTSAQKNYKKKHILTNFVSKRLLDLHKVNKICLKFLWHLALIEQKVLQEIGFLARLYKISQELPCVKILVRKILWKSNSPINNQKKDELCKSKSAVFLYDGVWNGSTVFL